MKRSWQIYLLAVGLAAGILYAQFYVFSFGLAWTSVLILSLSLIVLAKSKLGYLAFFVLAFVLGAWRMAAATAPTYPHIDDYQFQKATVVGKVVGEPFLNDKKEFQYYLDDLSVNDQPVAGQMKVKSQIGNACEGCQLAVTGKVWTSLGKTTSQMSYAKPTMLSEQKPWLLQVKDGFNRGLRHTLGPTEAAFMEGILIGARTQLPTEVQSNFNATGLSHVVAVSGYNLTILVAMLAFVFGRRWKWAGLVASLALIVCFVLIAGAGASVVRAALMSAIFLLGTYGGRRVKIEVCLALGLILTLLLAPTQLLGDLSWQLSFLSLAGIVFLSPKLMRFLPARGNLRIVSEILAVTLAAQLATMPLLAMTFGQISLIAPLANLIIMPLIPILMLVGLLSGLAGIIVPNLAVAVGRLINFVITQMLDLINWLAHLPLAARAVTVSNRQVFIFYIILICLSLLRSPKLSTKPIFSGIMGNERGNYVRTQ